MTAPPGVSLAIGCGDLITYVHINSITGVGMLLMQSATTQVRFYSHWLAGAGLSVKLKLSCVRVVLNSEGVNGTKELLTFS